MDGVVAWLEELGLPTRWERALDFGCGVGRLSQALAQYADEVVGADISEPMLEFARSIDRSDGVCRFVRNDTADLAQFPDGHFDFIYCALVLQHLPRPVIDGYLADFLRVLRPNGTAVVQVPTRALWTIKGLIWRLAPFRLIGWAQTRLLAYPAPMRMTPMPDAAMREVVGRSGGAVVGSMPDPTYTEDWENVRFALRRDA